MSDDPSPLVASGTGPQTRPTTPGTDRDLIDARCFALLLDAHREWEHATGERASVKALREWLWFYWQAPRRPRPLIRSKYPVAWPWSPAARSAYRADPRCELVSEHLVPVSVVIRELLDASPWNPPDLVLALHERLRCCVITKEEDRAITAAGFGLRMPEDASDVWARYRAAGLTPEDFGPLESDDR